jgi:hypothetical protein
MDCRRDLLAASICDKVEGFTAWAEDKKVYRLRTRGERKLAPHFAPLLSNKMSEDAGFAVV